MDPSQREQPEARRAEREQIRTPVDLLAAACCLLGRHVRRRPEREPELRRDVRLGEAGQAEVEHLHAQAAVVRVAREEDVVRLQIPVHDAVLVCGLEHLEHAVGDGQVLLLADGRSVRGAVLERLTLQQLHHEIGRAVVGSVLHDVVIEDLHGAAMLDAIRGVAFPQKSLADSGVLPELGVEDLHRRTRAVAMPSSVDSRHSAHADEALEGPLLVEDPTDARARLGAQVVSRHDMLRGTTLDQSALGWSS